jgi:hypothetical protein
MPPAAWLPVARWIGTAGRSTVGKPRSWEIGAQKLVIDGEEFGLKHHKDIKGHLTLVNQ